MFEQLSGRLTRRGYAVRHFGTKEEAAEWFRGELKGETVGFGGSVTLDEMNLYDILSENNEVIWHWRVPEGGTAGEIRRAARGADVYCSSVNGIAETGEIVNIDGSGNRVSETLYGHRKVYLIAGSNKLAPDLQGAIDRARNIAAPRNAQRLGSATPCAKRGDRCYDCSSPGRICRGLVVLWRAPLGSEYEVVLIDEPLGY